MSYDFSIKNPDISDWLNRKSSNAPVREFLYLHEHPLIRPNFLSDVEVLIFETGQHMLQKNISGTPANKLLSISETFASRLNTFVAGRDEDSAKDVLESLRDLYTLCTRIKTL